MLGAGFLEFGCWTADPLKLRKHVDHMGHQMPNTTNFPYAIWLMHCEFWNWTMLNKENTKKAYIILNVSLMDMEYHLTFSLSFLLRFIILNGVTGFLTLNQRFLSSASAPPPGFWFSQHRENQESKDQNLWAQHLQRLPEFVNEFHCWKFRANVSKRSPKK